MRARSALPLAALALLPVNAGSARAGTNGSAVAPSGKAAGPSKSTSVAGAAPPGGGLPAIAARADLDGKKLSLRACAAAPCDATGGETIPVALEDPLDPEHASVRAVDVGQGRRVLRVVLPSASRPGVAWEALVAADPGTKTARVLWSGPTGFGAGGEGSGGRVAIESEGLFVGRLRRELTLCGQEETLLEPKRLDPKTMTLHRVAMHRLPKAVRDAAPVVVAKPAEGAPIGSVLGVRGASVNDGASVALTDGDPGTAWTETLKGDGKGEFVVFSAPKATPLEKLSFVVRPTREVAEFAQPTSLWVSTDEGTFRVGIPKVEADGTRVDVPFPQPIATSCVAISIDRGENDGAVGLAEVDGVPVLPKSVHALEDLVTLLDAKDEQAELAQRVLAHAGTRGAKAIEAKLATIGDRGKERAVDALEAAPCKDGAPALARLAWDAPKAIATRARDALDACGVEARDAVSAAFSEGPDSAREVLAERYAKIDPKGALAAILEVVRTAPASRRHTYRIALGRVAGKGAGREAIVSWLASPEAAAPAKAGETDRAIELARAVAAAPDLDPSLVAPLSQTLQAHAGKGASFAAKYLAAEPMAALAARGDAASLAWMRALHHDGDKYLRARAVEASGDVDALRPEIVAGLKDPAPRVRENALVALRKGAGPTGTTPTAIALLHDDPWTFVRVAAAETLGEAKGGGDVDVALAKATKDDARKVRAAAIHALVTRGARGQLPAIRARAFDRDETVDVRVEAVEALGALCDASSADDLFDLAKRGSGSEGAHEIALAAILALGKIHPKDLAQRLSAIDQTSLVVKDAVRRAMKMPAGCS